MGGGYEGGYGGVLWGEVYAGAVGQGAMGWRCGSVLLGSCGAGRYGVALWVSVLGWRYGAAMGRYGAVQRCEAACIAGGRGLHPAAMGQGAVGLCYGAAMGQGAMG